jgi:biopolymer transport protein TolR
MQANTRRQRKRIIAEINVVPYIDVMLVLLVIFMVTAPMINQGVEVNLPQASAKPLTKKDNTVPIIVSVDAKGQWYLNISAKPTSPINAKLLCAEVAAAMMRDHKRAVVVRADKNVSYDTVLGAMVALQQAGVDNIGLETANHA